MKASSSVSRSGFTIVELLIVIVVIAILAAISVVAYNGVQERARNSAVLSGVTVYYKAMLNYRSVNGGYPTAGGCLGANYPSNVCWTINGSPNRSVNATLDTALQEFVPSKPTLATKLLDLTFGGYERAGLAYIPNDSTYGMRLTYYLSGNNRGCMYGGAQVNEGPLTQCNVSLP